MFTAKDIFIKTIDSKSANAICRKNHYSGKVDPRSQIHFGVFLKDLCLGVLQFGPSIDKRRMGQNLGIGMNEFIELNRMAFSDALPKFSESRALGYTLKILKKTYPHLRLVISFADACQCGDGTIYRASNFKLHSYKKNTTILRLPSGEIVADKTFNNQIDKKYKGYEKSECTKLSGFQMKYLYFFDKELENKFKFIPFDKIPKEVRMYKGIKRTELESKASVLQTEESGALPTSALHLTK